MFASRKKRFRPTGIKVLNGAMGVWTGLVFLFLYLPIAVLMVYSFNASRLNILWEGFTLKWFAEVWENTRLIQALKNSLIVAVFTTLASIVIGTAGAWLMHRYRYRFSKLIQTIICIPMIMPEIVMGISLLVFFTVINLKLGFATVIIAHTTFCFPFVLVAVQARLQGLDPALEEAALDLGADPLRAFWLVIVPCLQPAILSGGLMAFTLSMDELIVSTFTTSPQSATLPLKVFGMAKIGLNPMLNALSTVFIVTTVAFVLFSEQLRKMSSR